MSCQFASLSWSLFSRLADRGGSVGGDEDDDECGNLVGVFAGVTGVFAGVTGEWGKDETWGGVVAIFVLGRSNSNLILLSLCSSPPISCSYSYFTCLRYSCSIAPF